MADPEREREIREVRGLVWFIRRCEAGLAQGTASELLRLVRLAKARVKHLEARTGKIRGDRDGGA